MRGILLLCLLQGAFLVSSFGQNMQFTFGQVSPAELQMTSYEQDKDAEAVVLYNSGRYFYIPDYEKGGFVLNMEMWIRIKVISRPGVEYGTFEIPYYGYNDVEYITDIQGAVYNMENGTMQSSELKSKNIFDDRANKQVYIKKIAMPDVREGSVMELKYTIRSFNMSNMRKWEYQKRIPVVYSTLEYTAMPYYEFTYLLKGMSKFDEFNEEVLPNEEEFRNLTYKQVRYTMAMKNLPAFRDEEFTPSPQDHMTSLIFQLASVNRPDRAPQIIMTSWPEISSRLLKNQYFGKYLDAAEKEGKAILPTLGINGKSEEEQIRAITLYVKRNYNWDERSTLYSTDKISTLLKNKIGNSADLNLFLAGLLRAAGVDARPVVLSTRDNGMLSKPHPFIDHLNYVIVQANDGSRNYLIDASEPMLDFDMLPLRCLNVDALVVDAKSEEWITTDKKINSVTIHDIKVGIDPSRQLVIADGTMTATAYDAMRLRSTYKGNAENLKKMLTDRGAQYVEDITASNYDEVSEPFIFSYKAEYAGEYSGDDIIIHPFQGQSPSENIFKQTERRLPVSLTRRMEQFTTVIEIPEGYKVKYLPEPMDNDHSIMAIRYSAVTDGKIIRIMAGYNIKKDVYYPLEYPSLKTMYGEMVRQLSDRIILTKTE